jgi:hypothetical protein
MDEIREAYRRIGDDEDRFDVAYWQSQGPEAIFAAALELIQDYQLIRYGHAEDPRIDRTVEYYGKVKSAHGGMYERQEIRPPNSSV